MQAADLVPGFIPARANGSLKKMMVAHGRNLESLVKPGLDLGARLSYLAALIRVEFIFFGHMWALHT
jgi:hypothetical protein